MANRYFVANTTDGSGFYITSTTDNWSTTSGGAGGASVPTSGDNAIIDANSDPGGAWTIFFDSPFNCFDLDFTGALNNPVMRGSSAAALSIYGSLTMISGMTYTEVGTPYIYMMNTGSVTMDTPVSMSNWYFVFRGTGSRTLQDTMTVKYWTMEKGTVDTNNQAVNSTTFSFTGADSKTLTLGSSTITISSSVNYSGSNLTVTANTATIVVTGTGAFSGGDADWNGATISLTGTAHTMNGSFTCGDLNFINASAAQAVTITTGITVTVEGTFTATGFSAANRCTVQSSDATNATINAAIVSCDKVDFDDITGAGAGDWDFDGTDVRNVEGSAGMIFGIYWIGDTGDWETLSEWATTSGGSVNPLLVNDSITNAHFDSNSFSGASQECTINTDVSVRDLDFTGATNTPLITISTDYIGVYGDLTLISAMRITSGSNDGITLLGAGNKTITTNGCNIECRIYINSIGTYTLADDFTSIHSPSPSSLILRDCILDTAGYNISVYKAIYNDEPDMVLNLNDSEITCGSLTITGTVNAGTSIINVTTANGGSGAFNGGGETFYTVNLISSTNSINGSNTFTNLTFDYSATGAQTITLTDGTTQTITGTLTIKGKDRTDLCTVQKSGAGTAGILDYTAGTISIEFADTTAITLTPAITDRYFVNRVDAGGGVFNWSETGNWSNNSGGACSYSKPISTTDAYLDDNSVDAASKVIAIDETSYCADFNGGTLTNDPEFDMQNDLYIAGSVSFANGVTFSGASTIIITGSTSDGKTFAGGSNTFLDVTIQGSGNYDIEFTDDNEFGKLTVDRSGNNKSLSGTTEQTCSELILLPNGGTNTLTITDLDFVVASRAIISNYTDITNSSVSGGASFYAGNFSVDGGGNTGWLWRNPVRALK